LPQIRRRAPSRAAQPHLGRHPHPLRYRPPQQPALRQAGLNGGRPRDCLATNRRLTASAPAASIARGRPFWTAREVDMVYLPKHFTETDPTVLAGIMEHHSFATLISHGERGLIASQLPFMYVRGEGPHGTLLCHLARPNPQIAD